MQDRVVLRTRGNLSASQLRRHGQARAAALELSNLLLQRGDLGPQSSRLVLVALRGDAEGGVYFVAVDVAPEIYTDASR